MSELNVEELLTDSTKKVIGGRAGEAVEKHKFQEWNNESWELIMCFHEKNVLINLNCTILGNKNIFSMFFKVPPEHSKFSVNHY